MFRIMAGMHQKDSCLRCTGKLAYLGDDVVFFYGPLFLEVTCSSCLPEEYKVASFPGDDSRNGFCILRGFLEEYWSSLVVDFFLSWQMLFPMVLIFQKTIEIPQLLVDMMADVPFRSGCLGSHVQVVGGTVVLSQFLLVEKIAVSYEDVDIPFVTQRPIPLVQRWTIEFSQLQFALGGRCPYCRVVQVVHFPVVALMRLLMVQTLCPTIDFPQLLTRWSTSLLCMIVQIFPVVVQMPFPMVQTVRQFVLDKVIVVPVVQVERDPHVPSWRRQSCSHSCTRCGLRRGSSSSR